MANQITFAHIEGEIWRFECKAIPGNVWTKLSKDDIKHVLLVGGSTRIPKILWSCLGSLVLT